MGKFLPDKNPLTLKFSGKRSVTKNFYRGFFKTSGFGGILSSILSTGYKKLKMNGVRFVLFNLLLYTKV